MTLYKADSLPVRNLLLSFLFSFVCFWLVFSSAHSLNIATIQDSVILVFSLLPPIFSLLTW